MKDVGYYGEGESEKKGKMKKGKQKGKSINQSMIVTRLIKLILYENRVIRQKIIIRVS